MRLPRCIPWAASGLTLLLAVVPVRATGERPIPLPPQAALNNIRDLTATTRARRLLNEDPGLARLNLGVEVRNSTATVWGPIPSLAVGSLAKSKLESLPGINQVKSSFYLEEQRLDPLLELVKPTSEPERVEVAKPRELSPRVARTVSEGRQLAAPRSAAASLADQVAQLQRSEARFKGIVVELQENTVLVRRGQAPGRDVMELAEKLRRLPGVRQVVLSSE